MISLIYSKRYFCSSGFKSISLRIPSSILFYPSSCWKCGSQAAKYKPKCIKQECGALQPLEPGTTYFDVLLMQNHDQNYKATTTNSAKLVHSADVSTGFSSSASGNTSHTIVPGSVIPTFEVDLSELKRNYRQSQQSVHPDIYSLKEEEEKKISEDQSSFINKAYETLKDPLKRSMYILSINNITIDESEKSNDDPNLVMMVFAMMENIQDAESLKELDSISEENESFIQDIECQLKTAFAKNDFQKAKSLVISLRYGYSIRDAIDGKRDALEFS